MINTSISKQASPLGVRFAICGVNGSGKTTLCHALVSALRATGHNAVIASESARRSLFLLSRRFVPEMEIEILALQLAEEMQAVLMADIIICDRSVVDTYAYCLARFPELATDGFSPFIEAVNHFGANYVTTYAHHFYLSEPFVACESGDVVRDTDPVELLAVLSGFEATFAAWRVAITRVPKINAMPIVLNAINALIASQRTQL